MPKWIALILLVLPLTLFAEIKYTVRFEGVPTRDVLEKLEATSNLTSLTSHPPSGLTALKQRADNELPRILKVLNSYGYYNAEAAIRYQQKKADEVAVIIDVTPGPVFKLIGFNIFSILEKPGFSTGAYSGMLPEPDYDYSLVSLEDDLEIEIGKPAQAEVIIDAEHALISHLEHNGYPFARIEEPIVIADRKERTVSVSLYVNAGPRSIFGPVTIIGLESVNEKAVRRKFAWHEGELFDRRLIRETWYQLSRSGLFAAVNISYRDLPNTAAELPVVITVKERKHRTLGLGLSYSNQQAVGIIADWEHRNLRGMGEKITVGTDLKWEEQIGHLTYRKPDFLARQQDLIASAQISHERTVGYDARTYELLTSLNRTFSPTLDVTAGIGFKRETTTKSAHTNGTEHLLTLPVTINYDSTDVPLNPASGFALRYQVTPHLSLSSNDLNFTRQLLTMSSFYAPIDTNRTSLIWANKITLGSIAGAATARVPPSDLFNAGSDRLLRGYKYKTVSPLSENNKPEGGRNLWVGTTELRTRFAKDWGAVAFFDIGSVTSEPWPDFTVAPLKSAGFGLRYHTDFGPFRVDLAFPLDRRPKLDDAWEIYLSFGQAF